MTPIEEGSLEIQAPQAAAKKKATLKAQLDFDREALIKTMESVQGRRTIWRIFATTEFFTTSYTGNAETNFREGKRYIGRLLYEELQEVCPGLYDTMMGENSRRKKENDNA
jgi:hypothetical protein